ncbi:VanZ family protein [Microbacterium sp. Marseille-Q6965]|uniref:VanZ family protein n=1 Tax=Microbacterium sp. Marseille-Q6965 TaxID=2965072 RepID=UPI0021B7B15C|nr:VanZ family protein [Microbacterium sp. Marseille-Q6965]
MSGQLLPAVVAVLLGVVLGLALFVPFVAVQYRRQGRLTLGQLVLWGSFLVYGLALWTYTLLPLPAPGEISCVGAQLRPLQFVADIRSFPHASLTELRHNPAFMQVALNVLLFVPLGFFLRLGWRRGLVASAVAGFAISLLIETTQLTGVWGIYPCAFRFFDVDDLLANTTGALLGGVLSLAAKPWLSRRTHAVTAPVRPVSAGRRLVAMLCDALAMTMLGMIVGVAINAYQLYVGAVPAAQVDTAVAGTWAAVVPLAAFGLLALSTGRTVGDLAVMVRWEGGARPGVLRGLLRYLGGIGGWQLLGIVTPGADALFALASVVLVFAARRRGGLPGLVSGARPVDARQEPAAMSSAVNGSAGAA